MENIIKIENRGKIEIKNSNIKCFLGKNENYKSSEEIWKELKKQEITQIKSFYFIDEEKYLIYFPIPEKKISIITTSGKQYKSTVYFIDDIKNIISGLNIINPCYFNEDKYTAFKSENDYADFLFDYTLNEIKDIVEENIDYKELKNSYNKFEIKHSKILKDINKNIYLYSKIDNIEEERYYYTIPRTSLNIKLNSFYKNNKRNEINDVIYGIFGNYASGKSFFNLL